jgi:acyl carrier protein
MAADFSETLEKLRSIIIQIGVDGRKVVDSAKIFSDMELDSTESVDLSLEINRNFGVKVKLSTKEDLTLQALAELIKALQEQAVA